VTAVPASAPPFHLLLSVTIEEEEDTRPLVIAGDHPGSRMGARCGREALAFGPITWCSLLPNDMMLPMREWEELLVNLRHRDENDGHEKRDAPNNDENNRVDGETTRRRLHAIGAEE